MAVRFHRGPQGACNEIGSLTTAAVILFHRARVNAVEDANRSARTVVEDLAATDSENLLNNLRTQAQAERWQPTWLTG